ncbi:alpha/beta hydrolase family protein [Geodermatophilus sabuli]|uniref:Prolyl oligopeptidase family protein n=1 Tax=Geodermatophilus sabuli TaxID=1564158 RepID=A0A285EAH6_9ACTN|nr:alpha/beta fold hydrolase [Geodermatophilus sabuli]MBB3085436.1 acetyl esterase/lipase [Geodermatophilus sabuli]SNX96138.1 Prolyl oligopeptidase family protein [Geodermatophilus sabuli]
MSTTQAPYGPHPDQFVELTLPAGIGRAPVVVVVHGGFWRAPYGIELARPLAADLAAAGFAAVAVEYRRVGAGGGWPVTLEDVAAAVDALPDLGRTGGDAADRLDLGFLAVVGHSAGGQLAAWLAGRQRLPEGAPGARPRVRVTAAVLQAGVLDLELAAAQRMGDGAVQDLLGAEPGEAPDRYAVADPVRLVPAGVDLLCVHGTADDDVPRGQSARYAAAAAAAGVPVEVRWVDADHMALIDPDGAPWALVREWLRERAAAARDGSTLDP